MKVILAIPMIELVLAIVATIVPLLSGDEVADKGAMLIIFLVFLAMGEVVHRDARVPKEEFKGLTPETAAARLAEEAAGEPDQLEPADPAQIEASWPPTTASEKIICLNRPGPPRYRAARLCRAPLTKQKRGALPALRRPSSNRFFPERISL